MILHFSHIFLTEGLTFMFAIHLSIMLAVCAPRLFRAPRNTSLGQIIDRNFDGYAVTGQNPDVVHPQLAGYMRCNDVSVLQLDLKGRIRQRFDHNAFKFDYVVFGQKNHSLIIFMIRSQANRTRKTALSQQPLFGLSASRRRRSCSPRTRRV